MTWFDAVSLLSMEFSVRMSLKLPSTTWPPFFAVGLVVPGPHAASHSAPPARNAR